MCLNASLSSRSSTTLVFPWTPAPGPCQAEHSRAAQWCPSGFPYPGKRDCKRGLCGHCLPLSCVSSTLALALSAPNMLAFSCLLPQTYHFPLPPHGPLLCWMHASPILQPANASTSLNVSQAIIYRMHTYNIPYHTYTHAIHHKRQWTSPWGKSEPSSL